MGNSPAATAYYLERAGADARALRYLDEVICHGARISGRAGGVPVLYPDERFEALWAAYHWFLAGVPASRLFSPRVFGWLQKCVAGEGVSLSRTFPVPDADDTAVAVLLLAAAGYPADVRVLMRFVVSDGSFASFPFERHGSVGVNLHVLHALLTVPGYPRTGWIVGRLMSYLQDTQRADGSWLDKWHISPVYATGHAVCILQQASRLMSPETAGRAAHMALRGRRWLEENRNADGCWGTFGDASVEETAYAVLALAGRSGDAGMRADAWLGARRLLATGAPGESYPPMWIDKCLYTPAIVVRSVVGAARLMLRQGATGEDAFAARDSIAS